MFHYSDSMFFTLKVKDELIGTISGKKNSKCGLLNGAHSGSLQLAPIRISGNVFVQLSNMFPGVFACHSDYRGIAVITVAKFCAGWIKCAHQRSLMPTAIRRSGRRERRGAFALWA